MKIKRALRPENWEAKPKSVLGRLFYLADLLEHWRALPDAVEALGASVEELVQAAQLRGVGPAELEEELCKHLKPYAGDIDAATLIFATLPGEKEHGMLVTELMEARLVIKAGANWLNADATQEA
jgi:hypothetical protein